MAHVGMISENTWLSCYPKPDRCIHDNGGEFIGAAFIHALKTNEVHDVPTMIKNPQSNAICERMHQTVGNILCTLTHTNPPQNLQQVNHVVHWALAMAIHAT